jgi:hypothetical protein
MNRSGDKTLGNVTLLALFRCKLVDIFMPRVLEMVWFVLGRKYALPKITQCSVRK